MNTTTTKKKTLPEVLAQLIVIEAAYPEMIARLEALFNSGYTPVNRYVKGQTGKYTVQDMKRKQVYRIQVSETERKKSYPAAWCVDVPYSAIEHYYVDLPF